MDLAMRMCVAALWIGVAMAYAFYVRRTGVACRDILVVAALITFGVSALFERGPLWNPLWNLGIKIVVLVVLIAAARFPRRTP